MHPDRDKEAENEGEQYVRIAGVGRMNKWLRGYASNAMTNGWDMNGI